MWSILVVYYKLAKQLRRRRVSLDSGYQLILICKYLWIIFSWLLAIGFIAFTRIDEGNDFFSSIDISREAIGLRIVVLPLGALVVYHFIPTIRKQTVLIQKHYPNTLFERYILNFVVNTLRLSLVNIVGIWVIFCIGNSVLFPPSILVHAILQLLALSVIIFNVKELFLWVVPKMIYYLVVNLLLLLSLGYLNLYTVNGLIFYDIAILGISIILSFLTEHQKSEQREQGTLLTNCGYELSIIFLPFRNRATFNVIKFVLAFELLPLLSYNYLSLNLFKKIMYLTMMLPLTLMTNYGNNVFGFSKSLSANLFYRPVDNKSLLKVYMYLVVLPLAACYTISTLFFVVYSNTFFEEIIGYSIVSAILICTGFILSTRFPVLVKESSWLSNGQQSRRSLFISSSITAVWLILIQVSSSVAFACGLVSVIIIILVYLNGTAIKQSIDSFKQKLLIFLRG
ncbi:MAG TPA: hypothetical protein VIM75_16835 [Ohtaekwangia sp.]|uniref:hypothetical protein n=1 Tax=Ohtaekwangia sp. TaxID=2066019 RepID=UPI002F91EBA7